MRKDSPYYHGTIMCQQPPTDSTVATVPTVAAFTAVELEFRNNLSNYSNYRIHWFQRARSSQTIMSARV